MKCYQCAGFGCNHCTPKPTNQCDGCNAGIYRDVQGMHRDKDSKPIMVCQEYKYKSECNLVTKEKSHKAEMEVLQKKITELEQFKNLKNWTRPHPDQKLEPSGIYNK